MIRRILLFDNSGLNRSEVSAVLATGENNYDYDGVMSGLEEQRPNHRLFQRDSDTKKSHAHHSDGWSSESPANIDERTFFHASGVNSFCCTISSKTRAIISLASSSHALMSSALIPLLSADLFASFEFVDCSLQLFCRSLWNSHVFLLRTSMLLSMSFSPFSYSVSSCTLSSYNFLYNFPKTLAISFRDVMTSPFLFLTSVMSTLLSAELILGMFLSL